MVLKWIENYHKVKVGWKVVRKKLTISQTQKWVWFMFWKHNKEADKLTPYISANVRPSGV